ncbi:methyltransferase domain-containing protein [Geodermatophilus sp. SYSU D00965]
MADPALRPGARDIGAYLVSARSFDEYRAMFALSDADLAGRVLDCPGGGAGFTAVARARGTDAVAVDPVYATPPAALEDRLAGELERGRAWAQAHADRYVWAFYGDPAGHTRVRAEAARAFAADRAAAPGRYVCAALPALPFGDGAFDLVLSSHLLFTYADRLDRAFHRAALLEMARVSRGRVRVYPLVDQAGGALPDLLAGLVHDLAAAGVTAEVREVGYEFQRGARALLELTRD